MAKTQDHNTWLRFMTVQELRDRLEMYGWHRAELEDRKEDYADIYPQAVVYCDFMLSTVRNELARRDDMRRRYAVNRDLKTEPLTKRWQVVKDHIPITRLLWEEGFGEPAKAGNRMVMSCPLGLHSDTTPSFTIYPADRGWYCFGCAQGGTVVDLAMMLLKTNDPREALAHLEEIVRGDMVRGGQVKQLLARTAR